MSDATGWGLVLPVKGGRGAKSRLPGRNRRPLALAIALDTLAVAVAVVGPERVVVVSGDAPTVGAVRAVAPVTVVPDPGGGLDAAARCGVEALADRGTQAVAVLLADHPSLTPDELGAALRLSARHPAAFVPDADGSGTAMLTTTRPSSFVCAFGRDSAARHAATGAVRLELDLPGLRTDVDDDASLAAAEVIGLGPRTRAALLDYAADRAGEHPHH